MLLDMLATLTYEEAHAKLLAYTRDLLGHERVHSICNAIVKQYFRGSTPRFGQPANLLFTLDDTYQTLCKSTSVWWPGVKPAIDVPGIDEQDLLHIVSKNAGLFKYDMALRGFKLEMQYDKWASKIIAWNVSPL